MYVNKINQSLSFRLGFIYQPAGSEVGVTANQYKLFLNDLVQNVKQQLYIICCC